MKISVLNFNNYTILSDKIKFFRSPAQLSDSFNLSFNGYVDDAMDNSHIHCPVCNTKMLSEKDYNLLIKKAGEVNSTADFVDLLTEYRDYIPKNMSDILNNDNYINESLNSFVSKKAKSAFNNHKINIAMSKNYLSEYAEKLPENEKELLLKAIAQVTPHENYYNFKQKILPAIYQLNISKQDKFELSKNILPMLQDSSKYWSVFQIKNLEDVDINTLTIELFSKIFSNSRVSKSEISKNNTIENPHNEILLCSGCNKRSYTSKSFLPAGALDKRGLKDFIKCYLQDISFVMGTKSQEPNIPYIKNLCNFIKSISKQKIEFEKHEYVAMKKVNYAACRHVLFEPIHQTKRDIHCADCGTVMMPYAVQRLLNKDLQKASDLKDYTDIIVKYKKYIGIYSENIAKIFLDVAKKNPDLGEDDFIKILQKRVNCYSQRELSKAMCIFGKERNFFVNNKSLAEVEILDEVSKRMNKYIKSGKFDDFMYSKMFDEVFLNLDINNKGVPSIYSLCSRLKKICYVNSLAKPIENDALVDKNKLHTIVFNIFKPDFATTDHLLARSKNGSDTIDNLIGLCKACNSIDKGQKSTLAWFNNNPRIKYNFLKQLEDIDSMAKNKEIEGYDNWAKLITEAMYELTRGKFDARDKFSM